MRQFEVGTRKGFCAIVDKFSFGFIFFPSSRLLLFLSAQHPVNMEPVTMESLPVCAAQEIMAFLRVRHDQPGPPSNSFDVFSFCRAVAIAPSALRRRWQRFGSVPIQTRW